MPCMTSLEVAICGTHLGDTNEAASTLMKPAAVSLLTSSILTSAEMVSFSFCKPSRGPTSTILTFFGKLMLISCAMVAMLSCVGPGWCSIAAVALNQSGDWLAALQGKNFLSNLACRFAANGQRRNMRRDADARILPERMRR